MGPSPVVVPFFSFKAAPEALRVDWRAAIGEVLAEGVLIGGRFVREFEEAWAARIGVSGCVGVANGLDALVLALRALGIGPGKRVVVPAHTFIATWLAVRAVGAETVGIDVTPDGQLDLDAVERLTFNVDAVIPVHMHGITVDMPRLMKWAYDHGVVVLEDCAQAHGAMVGGRSVGSWGHAGAFSFYPTKNLGALGDAGAVVSNDLALLERVWTLANYGSTRGDKYAHTSEGVNSRLDPVQAAALSVSLKYLDSWNSRRRTIATRLLAVVESVSSIDRLPVTVSQSVWHHFILFSNNRDELRDELSKNRIATDIHYPILAAEEMAIIGKAVSNRSTFVNARRFSDTGLSLPMNQWLTDKDVDAIAEAVETCA